MFKKNLTSLLWVFLFALLSSSCTIRLLHETKFEQKSLGTNNNNNSNPIVLSDMNNFIDFTVGGQASSTIGVDMNGFPAVDITMPFGSVLTGLIASFSTDSLAVDPISISGVIQTTGITANDFVEGVPVIYTVTAEDGTTQEYYIYVWVEPAPLSNIATVSSSTYTVSLGGTAFETIVDVPFKTSKATFLSNLTKDDANQTWVDTDISDPVVSGDTLVVTAEDGVTQVTYTVTARTKYLLRETGPAGGLIFYIDPDPPLNLLPAGKYYLEAAPTDQSVGASAEWGCWGSVIPGADALTIGTGEQNTTDILASCAQVGIAASLTVGDLYSNGYSDWFLPSEDELSKLYINLHSGLDENGAVYVPVGNFVSFSYYYSSSEWNNDANIAWGVGFMEGHLDPSNKFAVWFVRAVRYVD